MNIELVIDIRERYLIKEFNKISLDFNVEKLDLGDILFRKVEEKEPVLIIERKTVEDLKASICDGRNREQKMRLLGSGMECEQIMYIIEGDLNQSLDNKVSGVPISTLIGSLINTQLRDNIKVYKTHSLFETREFLRKLYLKLNSDLPNFFGSRGVGEISPQSYANTLPTCKKSNMTSEVWFISQLSLIPQVSSKVGSVVSAKYGSLINLMREYEKVPEEIRYKLLSDLTYLQSSGRPRRVGDKISSRIYNFIYGK